MAGTIVESTKTNHDEITSDLSAAAGPAAEERQKGDQEDRRTGIQMERGKSRGKGGPMEGWMGKGEGSKVVKVRRTRHGQQCNNMPL